MTIAPRREADEAGFRELFDDEVIPVIRRLGERVRGAAGPVTADEAAARAAVWQGLADLGALAMAVPGPDGRPAELGAVLPLAELMGRALYQSPYPDTVLGAEVIAAGAPGLGAGLHGAITAGDVTIAVAARQDGGTDSSRPGPIDLHPASGQVSGVRRFVAFAPDVDFLLVVGSGQDGLTAALVPGNQAGVTTRRQDEIGCGDLYAVTLDRAQTLPGGADQAVDWPGIWAAALSRARLRQAGYLVGLCLGAIELSIGYARQREVFGQPLARFQNPAFRLAALAARAEAIRTWLPCICAAADTGADVTGPACQVLMLASELAVECGAEAIQLHGSYGMTELCDAQRFYRRALVDGTLLGTGTELRRQAAQASAASRELRTHSTLARRHDR